jgi:hypothetical protein
MLKRFSNEGMPKRFSNDDTMVWILFIRCKTQTWKFMCGRLPGKWITLCKQSDNMFISIPNMPSCSH